MKIKRVLILLGMFLLSAMVFAKNIVITSIQPTYSLAKYLTKGTDIEVYSPFGSDISMTISKEEIYSPEFDLSVAKDAQAVIDIAKIWTDDVIYAKARQKNIGIIEIDATVSYDEKKSTLFFNRYSSGEINPFVWTGSKNIIKMGNIIAGDLVRIYPKSEAKIEKNLLELTRKVVELEKDANNKILDSDVSEVISLSENLQYFLNDLNIYAEYKNYEEINENNIKDIIKDTGIKKIVSDRWVKKPVLKAIEEAGGKFVLINTLDIPYDMEDNMDPEGLLKAYSENVDNLIK